MPGSDSQPGRGGSQTLRENEKTTHTWVLFSKSLVIFPRISLTHFIKHKILISDELSCYHALTS